jgi:uncharacterized protein (TIGR00725 family)
VADDRAPVVAVVGPADASDEVCALAREVGRLLAERGATVVTGGHGGAMAAASQGARAAGGLVVGLLPGADRAAANEFVSLAIPTGLGQGRNALVVGAADAVLAVGGSWGTLSEIALARRTGKPLVCLRGWRVVDADGAEVEIAAADTPEEAVSRLARALAAHPTLRPDSRP